MNARSLGLAFLLAGCAVGVVACSSNDVDPPAPGGDTDAGAGKDAGRAECSLPSDCSPLANECVERTCEAGLCGEKPKAAGTAVDGQTAGDCKTLQCDGAGGLVTVNDDADVPVSASDCVVGACEDGVPSSVPKDVGEACGADGALKCDGAGNCAGCNSAVDCAGPADDACGTRTCESGVCGITFKLDGEPTDDQTEGDCKKVVCDGAGNSKSVNDDADTPDAPECKAGTCTNGAPGQASVADGTLCADDEKACLAGVCEGCVAAADCPASGNVCQVPACASAQCGFTNEPLGTACGVGKACNAAGACVTASCANGAQDGDETDTDCGGSCEAKCADGRECAVDSDCASDLCEAGVCLAAPTCDDGVKNGDEVGVDCGGACALACPAVASTAPADGDVDVLVGTSIAVTFATPMNTATVTGQMAAGACEGSVQLSKDDFATCLAFPAAPVFSDADKVATLMPAAALGADQTYKLKITAEAKDPKGNPVAELVASFKTKAAGAGACPDGDVVISQVYAGGGNAGAQYNKDFIELYNRGATSVNLAGWSVQYAGNAASQGFSGKVNLNGMIQPGRYFLIQLQGGATGNDLPAPDATTNSFNLGVGGGKVALVKATTEASKTCGHAQLVDLVGWGSASCYKGAAAAPVLSNTTAAIRGASGCANSGNNQADFTAVAPAPRNSASPAPAACVCN